MKSINQNNRNIQNVRDDGTIKRINRISKSFRSAKRGERAKMLNVLASEINQTSNNAVKNWLIKFDSILKSMEVAK